MFVGRKTELELLEEDHTSHKSEFCVVYGRRRVGKSTLLEKFCAGKPSFFFTGGKERQRQQLARFGKELSKAAGNPLAAKTKLSSWSEALELLDQNIGNLLSTSEHSQKAIIVFDEFQWMCRGAPGLTSDLQRFWDKKWKDSKNLHLILCGSVVSFILGEVLSRNSPLFGRRTRSFKLSPFQPPEAKLFLGERGLFEVAEVLLAVGGVPKYLELFTGRKPVRKILAEQALSTGGFFVDEIRFVLSEQLKETENYFMILGELANEALPMAELSRRTGIATGQIAYYLERLQILDFVSRHSPIGAGSRSKTIRYRLDDSYLRFFFKLIRPNLRKINRKNRSSLFDIITQEQWDRYLGAAFEYFVGKNADHVAMLLGAGDSLAESGSFWQHKTKRKKGVQVDLVLKRTDGITTIVECKWSRKKTGMDAVHQLRTAAERYPNPERNSIELLLVAAGGVTKAVASQQDIVVLTLEDFIPA